MHKISQNQMKALEGSIEKWRKVAYDNGFDNDMADCPLCQFNEMCINCIIKHETGCKHCNNTPYQKWTRHYRNKHCGIYSNHECICKQCTEIAIEEYNFLVDLKSKCEVSTYKSILEPFIMFIHNLIYI